MILHLIRPTLTVLLFSAGMSFALPLPQAQNSPTADANQPPSKTSPAQANPEQSAPTPAPATEIKPAGEKASPPPKPPVLRHSKRKTTGKSKANPGTKPTPDTSGKVVVKNGGAKDESPQIAPAIPPEQVRHDRASTAELLDAADANLKRLDARQLTSDEKSTMEEIRTYMRQAKAASAAGDMNRAQTLAYKARLLSDDLARK